MVVRKNTASAVYLYFVRLCTYSDYEQKAEILYRKSEYFNGDGEFL